MTTSFAVAAFLAAIVGTTPLPLVDRLAGSLRDGTPALEDAGPKVGLHVEKCFCADFDAPGLWFSLDSLDCGAVALRSGEAPVVASVPVSLAVRDGGCADAAVATVRPCPVPVADWKAPAVLARGTRCIAADAADAALASMVYAGLCDGTLSPRLPKWRPILLDMLAGRVRAGDFDHVFELLLATFPGSDSTAKIAAALEWVAGLPLAKDSADVCRALTRRYISTGEYDLAISAADLMAQYHAGYRPNALYLKAHAHAFAGRFDAARGLLGEALGLYPEGGARARILYLQAWILLQEGDSGAAVPLLKDVVRNHSSTKYARQALRVLESLE